MADYGTCVTRPFWKTRNPDAYDYFVREGWTKVTGDRQSVSFCQIFIGGSPDIVRDQAFSVVADLEQIVKPDIELELCLIEDDGTITPFSLAQARLWKIERAKRWDLEQERARVIIERIQRDMAADSGAPNPELDDFLS